MPLSYLSTRGADTGLSFEQVVLKGLASDGGLYIPSEIPTISSETLASWQDCSFEELAVKIMSLYIPSFEIPAADLEDLVKRSYSTFRHPERTPVKSLGLPDSSQYLLELFHGPTFAFKDVALQFLGNLFEYFLSRKNDKLQHGAARHHLTVIGATSGDTGSAAIYGLRGKKDIDVFILFPTGRVSPIQEAQMTTVPDANVHCVSVEGTFDDCQDIVKSLFNDPKFSTDFSLGAVNSINWARILAQITYYFHSYFSLLKQLGKKTGEVQVRYSVPTGNFGDILAGYYAARMGLPIAQLCVATNENDILDRFFASGVYAKHALPAQEAAGGIKEDGAKAHEEGAKETLSPAMDILVSSNFERLLWYLALQNEASSPAEASKVLAGWMNALKSDGSMRVAPASLEASKKLFTSARVSDQDTLDTIKQVYAESSSKEIIDPHTAVGVKAATMLPVLNDTITITLATAHPAKFANAVDLALKSFQGYSFEKDVEPQEFKGLANLERRVKHVRGLGQGRSQVMAYVEQLHHRK
ncbi:putative threonine synthase [Protomyces lactucae-debilis]|uniref:threonine synthase n=1 Tax=Protomyces lactucae-debilis TaxID=2754530 RepID=A0A1Y2EU37_PROLT|nr:putative threonine synthase [Protomyces lactucae-debilis]ORY75083.1 putative threonine synthase [Protomyces lactucae-debilis]